VLRVPHRREVGGEAINDARQGDGAIGREIEPAERRGRRRIGLVELGRAINTDLNGVALATAQASPEAVRERASAQRNARHGVGRKSVVHAARNAAVARAEVVAADAHRIAVERAVSAVSGAPASIERHLRQRLPDERSVRQCPLAFRLRRREGERRSVGARAIAHAVLQERIEHQGEELIHAAEAGGRCAGADLAGELRQRGRQRRSRQIEQRQEGRRRLACGKPNNRPDSELFRFIPKTWRQF
jgi:hypothetical protein